MVWSFVTVIRIPVLKMKDENVMVVKYWTAEYCATSCANPINSFLQNGQEVIPQYDQFLSPAVTFI
jgi:hypothetical protein